MLAAAENRFAARSADARARLIRSIWNDLHRAIHALTTDQGIAAVHDARIAARRMRALLRGLRDEINPSAYAQLRFDLLDIGRELAEVRTADIQLRLMRELSNSTRHLHVEDMLKVIALLERRAAATHKGFSQCLLASNWQERLTRIVSWVSSSDLLLRPVLPANVEYGMILSEQLARTSRLLRKPATSIPSLHKQRIRIKSARYVCELLQPSVSVDLQDVINQLNKGQDVLGEANDIQSIMEWLATTPLPRSLQDKLISRFGKRQVRLTTEFQRHCPKLRRQLRKAQKEIRGDALRRRL